MREFKPFEKDFVCLNTPMYDPRIIPKGFQQHWSNAEQRWVFIHKKPRNRMVEYY